MPIIVMDYQKHRCDQIWENVMGIALTNIQICAGSASSYLRYDAFCSLMLELLKQRIYGLFILFITGVSIVWYIWALSCPRIIISSTYIVTGDATS